MILDYGIFLGYPPINMLLFVIFLVLSKMKNETAFQFHMYILLEVFLRNYLEIICLKVRVRGRNTQRETLH